MPQVIGVGGSRLRCLLCWQRVGVSLSLWKRPEAKADRASRPDPWVAACPCQPRPVPSSASRAPLQGPRAGLRGPNHRRLIPGHSLVGPPGLLQLREGPPTGTWASRVRRLLGPGWLWPGAIQGHLPRRERRGERAQLHSAHPMSAACLASSPRASEPEGPTSALGKPASPPGSL